MIVKDVITEVVMCYKREDGSWSNIVVEPNATVGHGNLGRSSTTEPTASEVVQDIAAGPRNTPGLGSFGMIRYHDDEPIYDKKDLYVVSMPRNFDELAGISPRKYSAEELKTIGEDCPGDQGHWMSWNARLEMGLGSVRNTTLDSQQVENKTLVLQPATPRIKPLNGPKSPEPVGASHEGDEIWLSSPATLGMERTIGSGSVISFSDDEDIYSAEDQEPRRQRHEFMAPTLNFEIEHIEHSALQISATSNLLPRNLGRIAPTADSDIESLGSVSEPESDIQSWVNEPVIEELERTYKKNLAFVNSRCDRRVLAAEEKRLAELAELERKIQKCDEDWKAERKGLIERLEVKTKAEEACVRENGFLRVCTEAKAKHDQTLAGAANTYYRELNKQAAKAQALLKAIAEGRDEGSTERHTSDSSDQEAQRLTVGEIVNVIEELQMTLHKFWRVQNARKESTSTPEGNHPTTANATHRENTAECAASQWAPIDALIYLNVEAGPSTANADAEESSDAGHNHSQYTSGIPSSARALSSRLLKATKYNRELQERLRSITEKHEVVVKQYKVLLRDNTILQEHAWKAAENSAKISCYFPGPFGDENIDIPVLTLKAQIRHFRQQVADIIEERKSDKERHGKLQGHYLALNSKYIGLLSQPKILVDAQMRLAFLENTRIPELKSQVDELEREVRSRDDLHREDKEKREAKYDELKIKYNNMGKESGRRAQGELKMFRNIKVPALVGQVNGLEHVVSNLKAVHSALTMKYQCLYKELDQLKADQQRTQEAPKDLERRKQLQQRLADLKVPVENMNEVQKARYNVLDTQMSSPSRQSTTRKAADGITTIIERNVLLESQLQNAKDAHSKYDSLLEAHIHLQAENRIAKTNQIRLEKLRDDIEIERSTSEREKNWLERRLEASENVAKLDRSQLRVASIRQSELMNLNYKLKRDNLKLVRGNISFKEIEEYLRLPTANLDQPTNSRGLPENYFTLGASYKKLERVHEVEQEAHKVLKSRLQQANLKVYEMQQKLSEPQDFEAGSSILDSRPYKFNLRLFDIGRAGRSVGGTRISPCCLV
jgi:hypothetical protein